MRKRPKVTLEVPAQFTLPIKARMPGEGYPFWPRLIVGPLQKKLVMILSRTCWTYYCHHVDRTYFPCFRDDGFPCRYCVVDGPRRVYQGSLAVLDLEERRISMANLTKLALLNCPELEQSSDLAGRSLVIKRGPGGRNARMSALLDTVKRFDLPAEKVIDVTEVQKVQLNIWGVDLAMVRNIEAPSQAQPLEELF